MSRNVAYVREQALKAGVVCEVEKALGIEKLMVGLQTEQAVCVCVSCLAA